VHVNRRVNITASDNNKQGDAQAMQFGIPGHDDFGKARRCVSCLR